MPQVKLGASTVESLGDNVWKVRVEVINGKGDADDPRAGSAQLRRAA